jgi:hypothetical protein
MGMAKTQIFVAMISVFLVVSLVYVFTPSPGGVENRAAPSAENQVTPPAEVGASLPSWSVGDNWIYRFTYPLADNLTVVLTNEVVGENSIENVDCYEVKVSWENQEDLRWDYISKDTLTQIAERIRFAAPIGSVVERVRMWRGKIEYDFPLKVGNVWSFGTQINSILKLENGDNLEMGWTDVAQFTCSVVEKENVMVPAGEFESYLIETKTGTMVQYTWFSEAAKWFVKQERYMGDNLTLNIELLGFQ